MSEETSEVERLVREGKAERIGSFEYTAGASDSQPGYVVLRAGEMTYYLRPRTAQALAGALVAGVREAEKGAPRG